MKKLLLIAAIGFGAATASHAGLNVHIGIGIPAPPAVVITRPAPVYAPVYSPPPRVVVAPPVYAPPVVITRPPVVHYHYGYSHGWTPRPVDRHGHFRPQYVPHRHGHRH